MAVVSAHYSVLPQAFCNASVALTLHAILQAIGSLSYGCGNWAGAVSIRGLSVIKALRHSRPKSLHFSPDLNEGAIMPSTKKGNQGSSKKNMESKSSGNKQSGSQGSRSGSSAGIQGGTPEQHAAAGRQSHKNDKKK